jgi:hypothetical protein
MAFHSLAIRYAGCTPYIGLHPFLLRIQSNHQREYLQPWEPLDLESTFLKWWR